MYQYSYENLKQSLQTEKGQTYVKFLENYYNENYADKPILALKYSYAKLVHVDGNRIKHQAMYFDRRKRLMVLQVLAIADDKYIEPLEDIIAAICDEFTWVVPAHKDLLDLFASETSMYLAETVYVMQERLSQEIRDRIYQSIENKIIKKYESNIILWETKLRNNWLAVCSCGIGLTYLYLFPERFPLVKDRLFHTLNLYLGSIDEEGYCNEGYSYWVYGFGFFCLFFDVYEQLTGEHAPVLDSELIKKILRYGQNTVFNGNVFLPYADGGSKGEHDEAILLCTMERMFGVNLYLDEKELYDPSAQALGYRVIASLSRAYPPKDNKVETVFYKNSQVFIRQNGNYVFTVKGGHNREHHNHHDVGTFAIIQNGKQYIADVGVGEYTLQYFNGATRYTIFPCMSCSHSVPIVDGKLQEWGRDHNATVLSQDEISVTMDIAKAYTDGAEKLIAEYRTEKDGVQVNYSCQGIKEKIVFRFMSVMQPQIVENKVCIENMEITTDLPVCAKITRHDYSGYNGKACVVYSIDYEVNKVGDVEASFAFTFQ